MLHDTFRQPSSKRTVFLTIYPVHGKPAGAVQIILHISQFLYSFYPPAGHKPIDHMHPLKQYGIFQVFPPALIFG